MRTTKIRTVSRASLNALAYQGIRPCESFAQIRDTLGRHFGESHVSAFAEPVFNNKEGFVDWYVPFEGEPRPYALLSDEEKRKVTESYVTKARDIRAYADSLIATGDPQKVTRGNILKLALLYPGEDDLFLVGETPVVTCWGFGPGTQGAPVQNLCDLKARVRPAQPVAPAAEPPVAPVEKEREVVRAAFWPWLLPLLLLLLLLLLVFSDIGSIRALGGYASLHLPSLLEEDEARERDLLKKRHELEEELRLLEKRLVEHIAQCRRALPPAGTAVPPAVASPKEELVIPENVSDTRFLKGRWLCATGLFNSMTQEPVKVEFVFDDEGKGQGHVYQKDDLCRGKASAAMKDGVLAITHEALRCSKGGNTYAPNEIECRNTSSGRTECRGKSSGGLEWNAFFLRLGTE